MKSVKKTNYFRACVAAMLLNFVPLFAAATPMPDMSNNSERQKPKVQHTFLKGGWKSMGIALVDKDMKIIWNHASGDEMTDAWYLKDGGAVFSFSNRKEKIAGIKRLDEKGKLKWEYKADPGRDNHSAQPLPEGRFLAAETDSKAAYIIIVNDKGKKEKEIKLELTATLAEKAKNKNHFFRMVRMTPEGTYLAACMAYNKAVEWDQKGNILQELADCNFAAVRLANGNTLVSGRKGVLEYDKNKQVVWSMQAADFEKLGLHISMICGIQRLANGNTVISNVWHGKITDAGDYYKIIEVTKDKELVWWVEDPKFKTMNLGSVQIIDSEGDAAQFEVWK